MVDTAKYSQGTFSWTIDLLNRYGLDERDDPLLLHHYHEAEYVAEYELLITQDMGICVSFEDLVTKGGLFEILPELGDDSYKTQLWRRLQQLRDNWYCGDEVALTSEEIQRALKLALCFGGQWVPPMMMWALAIRTRQEKDEMLSNEFRDDFYGRFSSTV